MATHSIQKFRFTKSINKEQIKLLKQQLNDKNPLDSQKNNSQQVLTNLAQQFQKLNSQTLNITSIFDEIKQQKPLKFNQYVSIPGQNFDQSLNTIIRKLQQSTPPQYQIKQASQNCRKQSQLINSTNQNNEGTIKVDYQF